MVESTDNGLIIDDIFCFGIFEIEMMKTMIDAKRRCCLLNFGTVRGNDGDFVLLQRDKPVCLSQVIPTGTYSALLLLSVMRVFYY